MSRFPNEKSAHDYFVQMRWGGKPVCPHCNSGKKIYVCKHSVYMCPDCKKRFTVTVGTVFEASKIPLKKWIHAIYLDLNGISSVQLAKKVGLTQKSAWFVLKRIRSFKLKPLDKAMTVLLKNKPDAKRKT